tara:strand:+ start:33844 stop:34047 length:204 start_codon:yes stop_codon:yes gene_type:complete
MIRPDVAGIPAMFGKLELQIIGSFLDDGRRRIVALSLEFVFFAVGDQRLRLDAVAFWLPYERGIFDI